MSGKRKQKPRKSKPYRVCAVFLSLLVVAAVFFSYVLIAEYAVEFTARRLPSYAKEDLTQTLAKESWSSDDYNFLYRQTGLGACALASMKDRTDEILRFQEALFYEGTVCHVEGTFPTKYDKMDAFTAPIADLQAGDVLVSSVCHTLGFRNGHAALVADEFGNVLESVSLGTPSVLTTNGANWFQTSANFIVLRLKDASAEERAAIAQAAKENLIGVPYSLTVGIFSKKDQGTDVKKTHCSHLVWQAYKNFGYDIDSNGGPVCFARDIARSPLFEVVQVYGFDPLKLW